MIHKLESLAQTRAENFVSNVLRLDEEHNRDVPDTFVVNVVANCVLEVSVDTIRMSRRMRMCGAVHNNRQFASLKFHVDGSRLVGDKRALASIFGGKDADEKPQKKSKKRKRVEESSEEEEEEEESDESSSDEEQDDGIHDVSDEVGSVAVDDDDREEAGVEEIVDDHSDLLTAPVDQTRLQRKKELAQKQRDFERALETATVQMSRHDVHVVGPPRRIVRINNNGFQKRYITKVNINGASTPMHANAVAWLVAKVLQDMGVRCEMTGFEVSNIVATCAVGFWVDPLKLQKIAGLAAHYDPMRIVMVKVINETLGLVCLVFPSGRIVISSGLRLLDVAAGAQWIYRLCVPAKGDGPMPTANELKNAYQFRFVRREDLSYTDAASVKRLKAEKASLDALLGSDDTVAERLLTLVERDMLNKMTPDDQALFNKFMDIVSLPRIEA